MNRRAIHGPPNSPGGRLMPCSTMRSGATPAGRASKYGDNTCLTPTMRPVATSTRMLILAPILPHPRATIAARANGTHDDHELRQQRLGHARSRARLASVHADEGSRDRAHDPAARGLGRVARGLRGQALPRRHQLLVGEPLRPRESAHQRRGRGAARPPRARDLRRLHARARRDARRGAACASRRRASIAASSPTTAPPRSKWP